MNKNLDKLTQINPILAKLVDGQNLTTAEAEKLIHDIFVYDEEGLRFATFVGAIHAKGETADELLGFLNATKKLAVQFDLGLDTDKITDLSGTGGGSFKTINVSTIASFIVAAAGYTVAKESYFGITSPTGSADIFTAFGVDFLKLSKEKIEDTLKEVRICPIIVPFISPKMKNRSRLSKKYFVEGKVRVRSLFHLASNVYSPVSMSHRIYGCYSEKYIEILSNLFMKLGFKRSITFYAKIGMPEISNVGETIIAEQNKDKIKKYIVSASDFGIKEAREKDIETGGKEQNIKDFIQVLQGKEKGPKADLVLLNAGASLYSLEDVTTIKKGVNKAREILYSGQGYIILEKLISRIGLSKKLSSF